MAYCVVCMLPLSILVFGGSGLWLNISHKLNACIHVSGRPAIHVSKRNGLHTGSCVVHKVDGGVNRSVGWDWLVLLHSCIRCSSCCMLCEGMCVCVSASERYIYIYIYNMCLAYGYGYSYGYERTYFSTNTCFILLFSFRAGIYIYSIIYMIFTDIRFDINVICVCA